MSRGKRRGKRGALGLSAGLLLGLLAGLFALQARQGAPVIPFDPAAIPAFQGEPWVEINGSEPYFTDSERTDRCFEQYSELDGLGRCGAAFACVGRELMPTGEREGIGQIKPSGWQTVRYDDLIEGKYLYNRCHLIAFQLAGVNADPRNLITGTRYLNTTGMLPLENRVADYVRQTGNHVLYRVTPVFGEGELVARGVLLEAESVEDGGAGVRFCVYAYNVQPGVEIDYLTGGSRRQSGAPDPAQPSGPAPEESASEEPAPEESAPEQTAAAPDSPAAYVGNKNSMRFHRPDCPGAADIKPANRVALTGGREEAIALGYAPCKMCEP